jgi:hypothetical protein
MRHERESTMIGEVRMFQGQRYECEAIEPYTRKDGAQSSIALWGTHCATCGQPFTAKMAIGQWDWPSFSGPIRRCRDHAKSGRAVRYEGMATKNLRILKMSMVAAHPDHGGTSAEFIKARTAYVEAKMSG